VSNVNIVDVKKVIEANIEMMLQYDNFELNQQNDGNCDKMIRKGFYKINNEQFRGGKASLTCRQCKEIKPLACFAVIRYNNHQKDNICKTCASENRKRARAEYPWRFAEQEGRCKCCNKPESMRSKSGKIIRLASDHDHYTGDIRGLLCHSCNTRLGEEAELHRRMADYLENNGNIPMLPLDPKLEPTYTHFSPDDKPIPKSSLATAFT
jgi:hypothetical protein